MSFAFPSKFVFDWTELRAQHPALRIEVTAQTTNVVMYEHVYTLEVRLKDQLNAKGFVDDRFKRHRAPIGTPGIAHLRIAHKGEHFYITTVPVEIGVHAHDEFTVNDALREALRATETALRLGR